jgi:replicative DNA helicase
MTEKEIDLLLATIETKKDWIKNNDVTSLTEEELQIEKVVLGSIMEYNTLINYLCDTIFEGFFKDSKHQKVIFAISELFTYSAPLDAPNISIELKKINEYEFVGGQAFLDDLLTYSLINKKNTDENSKIY